jgi:hypothetical protein
MILATCSSHEEATAEAAAKAGDRRTIRLARQPVRAPAALTACQCRRCEHALRRSGAGDDLDAFVADLAEGAPPLTSEQRDKLALLLHDHCRSGAAGIRMPAA